MFSEKEKIKIKKDIKEEVSKRKLDSSKIKEIEKILEFLIDQDQNISSILGATGAGKTISINIAINIFQKNIKQKNRAIKKIIKIDLWTLFGLKSKTDYCENCLPSTNKKLIDNNLNFYSYAPHEFIIHKQKIIDNQYIIKSEYYDGLDEYEKLELRNEIEKQQEIINKNKLVITSFHIKKTIWTSIVNKICYNKQKSNILLKTIKHEKININEKNKIFKRFLFSFLILFIGGLIGLSFLAKTINNFNIEKIIYTLSGSGIIGFLSTILLFSWEKRKSNTREININQTLIDQSTNDILNKTINNAFIEEKIWFLKWPIKFWKYLRFSYKDKNIILHFENIDRLWDWLKLSDSNKKLARSKIIIEILENIALLYKSDNIKILIEFDDEVKNLISDYNKNRKIDYYKRIIGDYIEIKSLNKNSLLELDEKWKNEEKIIIEKIGDELVEHKLNSWRLKNEIVQKIKSFSKKFKKFIEIDKLEKVKNLDLAFKHWYENKINFPKNKIDIDNYDWNKEIKIEELFNHDLLEIIYLFNNPFRNFKVNNEYKLNLFVEEYIEDIAEKRKKEREEQRKKHEMSYGFDKKMILNVKNVLYERMLKAFEEKYEKIKNDSKIILNAQFSYFIFNKNYFNVYEIYNFFNLALQKEKLHKEIIKCFFAYIQTNSSSLFEDEDEIWIDEDERIFIVSISRFLELLDKDEKDYFWKINNDNNNKIIKNIVKILNWDKNNWKYFFWEIKDLNFLIKEIWNKLNVLDEKNEIKIELFNKYKDSIFDKDILENFLKDFNFETWKQNTKNIITIKNNLIENNFATKEEIIELFHKHKEENLTKKELNEWIKKKGKNKIANFSERQKEHCWEKAPKRNTLNEKEFRFGAAGALIKYKDYGDENSKFGWNIDHKIPTSAGGSDEDSNIRAMHRKNNIAKGDDYQKDANRISYYRVLVYNENQETNVESNKGMSFTDNEAKDE